MVRVSLNGLIFSLLPFIVSAAGVEEPLIWRILGGVFCIVGSVSMARAQQNFQLQRHTMTRGESIHKNLSMLVSFLLVLFLILSAIGLTDGFEFAIYAATLIYCVVQPAEVFWFSIRESFT